MLLQCDVIVQSADESLFWKIAELCSPILLFGAGYLLNHAIEKRKDRKHKKQITEVVRLWLKEIRGHAALNVKEMSPFIIALERYSNLPQVQFYAVVVDRFLSISDSDLKLAIDKNSNYLDILSCCHGVKVCYEGGAEFYWKIRARINELFEKDEQPDPKDIEHWIKILTVWRDNLQLLVNVINNHLGEPQGDKNEWLKSRPVLLPQSIHEDDIKN